MSETNFLVFGAIHTGIGCIIILYATFRPTVYSTPIGFWYVLGIGAFVLYLGISSLMLATYDREPTN